MNLNDIHCTGDSIRVLICLYSVIRLLFGHYHIADSYLFDADVYQISLTFYPEAISLVHIEADN